jgi:ABC-type sulfate/molybdate transport systems ATPase subunit
LRAIDLDVHASEVVGVCGPAAAGKTALLLCCAGLLRPTSGVTRWFGRARLTDSARNRVILVPSGPDALRRVLEIAPSRAVAVILVDDPFRAMSGPDYARLARWLEQARRRGNAVVFTSREPSAAGLVATRVLTLHDGSFAPERIGRTARVAERAEFG